MTFVQVRVTSEDKVVSAVVPVPTWAVCGLKQGDRIRLQSAMQQYSPTVWTVEGFGHTTWGSNNQVPALPFPVDQKECPVWRR